MRVINGWSRNRQGEWTPADKNPTQDALDDMKSLREYLRKQGDY